MPCKCDQPKRNYYSYYDTPEGCDIEKKVMATTRYGVVAGLIISTYDVLMFSHAVGMRPILKRYMYHTVPLGLMGATFAIVANGALKIREKDDHINYFLGGMACGPILASYLGSVHAVLMGGLALGIIGMAKKEALVTGHECFAPGNQFPNSLGLVNTWRHDFTLVQDPRDLHSQSCGRK